MNQRGHARSVRTCMFWPIYDRSTVYFLQYAVCPIHQIGTAISEQYWSYKLFVSMNESLYLSVRRLYMYVQVHYTSYMCTTFGYTTHTARHPCCTLSYSTTQAVIVLYISSESVEYAHFLYNNLRSRVQLRQNSALYSWTPNLYIKFSHCPKSDSICPSQFQRCTHSFAYCTVIHLWYFVVYPLYIWVS